MYLLLDTETSPLSNYVPAQALVHTNHFARPLCDMIQSYSDPNNVRCHVKTHQVLVTKYDCRQDVSESLLFSDFRQ